MSRPAGVRPGAAVIGKVVRGWRVAGLIRYLFGPGRHHEHTDQHVIASWDGLPERHQPPRTATGDGFDTTTLSAVLADPAVAAGVPLREPSGTGGDGRRGQGPVWHCSLRTAPGDRVLTDEEWAEVVVDVLGRTGIAPAGDAGACRWVAVRHAVDHVHIAAVLVRQDTGRRVAPYRDYHRVREACLAAEAHHGLVATSPADRTATPAPTRAETEKAARAGRDAAARVELRAAVATAAARSASIEEFAAAVTANGLVQLRWRTDAAGRPVGYAVAARHDRADPRHPGAGLVWFGGRTLDPDLSLPRLRARFAAADPLPTAADRPTLERRAAWADAHTVVE
ncbi:relaxase/mobilization nuclease domain-containing protein, partial [Actinokineospora sp. PR83]|uniref:relaxase/mobilization nuclease domain-containing protein n=1 Tax=Actinokineospora sp. PR83 TaxID=2884908 RepID=UPI0027E16E78